MFSYIESISPNEAEEVRKTIQELWKQTCILQTKYDPVTLIQRDNSRYQSCMRHREFISAYLEVMGCELIHDPQEHLFRIVGEGLMIEKATAFIKADLQGQDHGRGTACDNDESGGNPYVWERYESFEA